MSERNPERVRERDRDREESKRKSGTLDTTTEQAETKKQSLSEQKSGKEQISPNKKEKKKVERNNCPISIFSSGFMSLYFLFTSILIGIGFKCSF